MKISTAELIIYQSASNLQGIVNTRLKTSTIRAQHRIQGANQPPSKHHNVAFYTPRRIVEYPNPRTLSSAPSGPSAPP